MASSGDEQEFVRRLEEQLRQLKVADVLTQTVMTISQLAWSRLSGEARDLDQARLAIEALRALVPVLKGAVDHDLSRDLQQVVANLQLAYAGAVAQAGATPDAGADEPDSAAEGSAASGAAPEEPGSAAAGSAASGSAPEEAGSAAAGSAASGSAPDEAGSAAAGAAAPGSPPAEGGSAEGAGASGAAADAPGGAETSGGADEPEQAATEPPPADEPPAEPVTES